MAPKPALPSPQQVQWQNMERTMFVHFAPNTWQGTELDNRSTPLSYLYPEKLDVNQWIDATEAFKSTFPETFSVMKSFPKTFPVINRTIDDQIDKPKTKFIPKD
jgi:hypothetical protein